MTICPSFFLNEHIKTEKNVAFYVKFKINKNHLSPAISSLSPFELSRK